MTITAHEACRLLARELPPTATHVRRALRFAQFWGAFPRAYTPDHHALGKQVLESAGYALDWFRLSGKLPLRFTEACRELLATADAEGRFA